MSKSQTKAKHGTSATESHPYGTHRIDSNGNVLAPRSLRQFKNKLLSNVDRDKVEKLFGCTYEETGRGE